jgi:hypothetical protein
MNYGKKKPAERRVEIILSAVVLWVARQGSRVTTILVRGLGVSCYWIFYFLGEFLVEAVNFGAHFFEYIGFINADAGFGDADFFGYIGVGDFLGDIFKDVAFVFV